MEKEKRTEHSKILFLAYIIVSTLLLALLLSCVGFSIHARAGIAKKKNGKEKVVSSVCVREGDSLWSIASDFYTEEYSDINELIDAIKNCNGVSEYIYIGQKLYIPHYNSF